MNVTIFLLAGLVSRRWRDQPLAGTHLSTDIFGKSDGSSVARMSPSQGEGRRFESGPSLIDSPIPLTLYNPELISGFF